MNAMNATATRHPLAYVDVPADSPTVTVYDHQVDRNWLGVVHDGIVNDRAGIIDPEDIGVRFTIYRDGVDVSVEFAA